MSGLSVSLHSIFQASSIQYIGVVRGGMQAYIIIHGCFIKVSSRMRKSKLLRMLSMLCCVNGTTPSRRARRMNPFGFCYSVLQILGGLRVKMSHASPEQVDNTKYSIIFIPIQKWPIQWALQWALVYIGTLYIGQVTKSVPGCLRSLGISGRSDPSRLQYRRKTCCLAYIGAQDGSYIMWINENCC